MINKLIYFNIIIHVLPNYMDIYNTESVISYDPIDWIDNIKAVTYHSVKNPIPINHFREILYKCIPSSIKSNKERYKWERRIVILVDAYEKYIYDVCGAYNSINEGGEAHAKRLEEYKNMLNNNNSLSY